MVVPQSPVAAGSTQTLQTRLINNGRAWAASSRFSSVSSGDSIFLFVENPSDSGFDYDLVIHPRGSGLCDVDISFDATEDTEGSDVAAQNLKSGSDRSFSGDLTETTTGNTGSYSHGTIIFEDFVQADSSGIQVGAEIISGISCTIDEGDNKLLELNNGSGGTLKRLAFNVVIFEVDGTYKTF